MHKVSNIIFAVLRDSKTYELKTPEEQRKQYLNTKKQPKSLNYWKLSLIAIKLSMFGSRLGLFAAPNFI